jgi:hypothetical protein
MNNIIYYNFDNRELNHYSFVKPKYIVITSFKINKRIKEMFIEIDNLININEYINKVLFKNDFQRIWFHYLEYYLQENTTNLPWYYNMFGKWL